MLAALAISLLTGWGIADRGRLLWFGVLLAVVLSVAVIYLSLRPDLLLIGWLFAAPFLQESARSSHTGRNLTNVIFVLPIAIFVLHLVMSKPLARPLRWYDALPLAYLVLILGSQGAVGASQLKSHSFYSGLLHGGVLVAVPLYYFCAFGPIDSFSPRHLSIALLASSSVVGAMAVIEHFVRWNLWGQDFGGHPRRVVSTLAQPAILGAFLGAGIILATAVLVWGGPRDPRRLSIATLVIASPALLFTYTRGPILATAAIVSLLILAKPRVRLAGLGVVVIATVLIVGSWSRISSTSIYHARAADTVNVKTRLLISEGSLHAAWQRPILGWGHGKFDTAKNNQSINTGDLPETQFYDYTSHDSYLTILVELGFVGLALFLLPWLIIASKTLRAVRKASHPEWLSLALLGILGVVALTALTTDMRFFSFVPSLAWIAVGLLRRRDWDETAFTPAEEHLGHAALG
jgi:O-antigen ligase